MAKHTPGEWAVQPIASEDNVGYRYRVGPKHGWSVAYVCNGDDADANACLIAAAPALEAKVATLLAALKDAVAFIDDRAASESDYALATGCRAAIAQAEGQGA